MLYCMKTTNLHVLKMIEIDFGGRSVSIVVKQDNYNHCFSVL